MYCTKRSFTWLKADVHLKQNANQAIGLATPIGWRAKCVTWKGKGKEPLAVPAVCLSLVFLPRNVAAGRGDYMIRNFVSIQNG